MPKGMDSSRCNRLARGLEHAGKIIRKNVPKNRKPREVFVSVPGGDSCAPIPLHVEWQAAGGLEVRRAA
jgi:hypothetical protein